MSSRMRDAGLPKELVEAACDISRTRAVSLQSAMMEVLRATRLLEAQQEASRLRRERNQLREAIEKECAYIEGAHIDDLRALDIKRRLRRALDAITQTPDEGGFTWEDVAALETAIGDMAGFAHDRCTSTEEHEECRQEREAVQAIADRIAARLPPRQDRGS